tara:strand:- start:258 stop:470 length:213 start_codon:yes stop_codon:yes gene_type:complete
MSYDDIFAKGIKAKINYCDDESKRCPNCKHVVEEHHDDGMDAYVNFRCTISNLGCFDVKQNGRCDKFSKG